MRDAKRYFSGLVAFPLLCVALVHCGGVNNDDLGGAASDTDDAGTTSDAGHARDSGSSSARDSGAAIDSGGVPSSVSSDPDDPIVYGISSNGVYTSLILYSFNVVTSELKNLADFTVGSTQLVNDLAVDENGNFFLLINFLVSGGAATYETFQLTIDSAARTGSIAPVTPEYATSHVSSIAFRSGSPSLLGGGSGAIYAIDLSKSLETRQGMTLPAGSFYDDLACTSGGVCWEDVNDLQSDGGSSGIIATFLSDMSSAGTTYMDHTGGYCPGLAYAKGFLVCFGSDNTIRKIDLSAPFKEFQSVFPTGDALPASYAWLGGASSSTHE